MLFTRLRIGFMELGGKLVNFVFCGAFPPANVLLFPFRCSTIVPQWFSAPSSANILHHSCFSITFGAPNIPRSVFHTTPFSVARKHVEFWGEIKPLSGPH